MNSRTLFATHYHELTELTLTLSGVKNYNIAVKEWNDQIIFLRKLVEGGTNRSYGIQVARLAGVPDEVIVRAKKILYDIENSGHSPTGSSFSERGGGIPGKGLRESDRLPGASQALVPRGGEDPGQIVGRVGQVGLALSVVTGMTLGIVVDDTVHFLSKYLRARREKGLDAEDAVRYAFSTVGLALVVTSLVLVCGFLVLTNSAFALNSNMAFMTAVTIVFAIVADFLLLPPLLMAIRRKRFIIFF